MPGAVVFVAAVTWRVGAVRGLDDDAGHALRRKIKGKSAAALLRSAGGGVAGLPLSRATIWLIGGCRPKKRV